MLIHGKKRGNSSEDQKQSDVQNIIHQRTNIITRNQKDAYPVPDVKPSKGNHKKCSWPSVLASNYENAQQSSVH